MKKSNSPRVTYKKVFKLTTVANLRKTNKPLYEFWLRVKSKTGITFEEFKKSIL